MSQFMQGTETIAWAPLAEEKKPRMASQILARATPKRVWPVLGLLCLLTMYVLAIVRLHPENFFGVTQDDTIYFSSAKALAAGHGYVMPDLPGQPPASKYPILYSWILSLVWRWNPVFPQNLTAALNITLAFGVVYVTLSFLLLRRLRGINDLEALLLTAFCAFHPTILFYSASALSDLPFSAVALAAMVVANRAMRREAHPAGAFFSGILAALSMLIRVFGIAIVAGIFCTALFRRAWKQAMIVAGCAVPVIALTAWNTLTASRVAKPAGFDAAGMAYRSTWLYYTSYLGFRKLAMVNLHMVVTIVVSQLTYFFTELPAFFVSPLFRRNLGLLLVGTVGVFWMVFAGLIREARENEWHPVHFTLLFTMGIIFCWNYPEVRRFLIPFFPLLAASIWIEGKWLAGELRLAARKRRSAAERGFATALLIALCAGGAGIAWNSIANKDRAALRTASRDRAALLEEKRQAYNWILKNAAPDARVVAGEDAALYLYTGRQAMAHIALRRSGAYEEAYLQEDLAHITDVAKAISAQYWVGASDDSEKQWVSAKAPLAARFKEVEDVLPEVFGSSSGRVRIYSLGCVQHPEAPECEHAARVLFPQGK